MPRGGEFRCGTCDVLLFGWQGNLTLGASEIRATCPKCGEERVFQQSGDRAPAQAFFAKKPVLRREK